MLPANNTNSLNTMSIKTYYKVWKILALNALQEAFVNRATNVLFMVGKAMRLVMTVAFLLLIRGNVQTFAGYSTDQLVIFFLMYQILDVSSQVLFRGVYLFSNLIKSGEFDFYLSKPINPLFRALTGLPDINDALFLVPNMVLAGYLLSTLSVHITITSAVLFFILCMNSFLMITALHIFILAVGILITEVDGMVWLYRDLTRLGQFPITMYAEPLRLTLFFVVPIGFMLTIPAQVLSNLVPTYSVAFTLTVGILFFLLSLRTWSFAVKRYSSASS